MKRRIVICLVMAMAVCLFACGKRDAEKTKPETKESIWVVTNEYHVEGDTEYKERSYEYDEYGSITKMLVYEEDGNTAATVTYEYKRDEKGRIVEEVFKSLTDGYEDVQHFRYTLDEQGNRTRVELLNRDGEVYDAYAYEYDEHGNETHAKDVMEGGQNMEEIFYKYTYEEDRMVLMECYDSDSKSLISVSKYEYDKDGKKTVQYQGKELDEFYLRDEYLYDDNGAICEIRYYNGGDVTQIMKYENDEHGNPTMIRSCWGDGDVRNCTRCEYKEIVLK